MDDVSLKKHLEVLVLEGIRTEGVCSTLLKQLVETLLGSIQRELIDLHVEVTSLREAKSELEAVKRALTSNLLKLRERVKQSEAACAIAEGLQKKADESYTRVWGETVNDVLLGITQAGITRYLNRQEFGANAKKGSSSVLKKIRLRSAILVNLRPIGGIQDVADMMAEKSKVRWGNLIGYIMLPFSIATQQDPLEHIRQAKATIDRKKHSLEAVSTYACAKLVLSLFGVKVAAFIIRRVLLNTTLAFSNMPGPVEEVSFYGHPVAYIAPSVYGHPQALTMHFQSYANKMIISLSVDPSVIPDPYLLCDDFEESLKLMRDVVQKKPVEDAV
ncbi:hypothetical protein Ahy_B06g085216 isoform C [Arachis hypogaea]|uniref:O-acyltransferase WSD1 C-terminal domain-containing protein n=1 Tax=Arachis hypogaea TaxID=3818 RepID=A0A444YTU3_ARAHY|nr:hypothetical protein Ahy_B06g085216 isoform C [Arachis hypogaea]